MNNDEKRLYISNIVEYKIYKNINYSEFKSSIEANLPKKLYKYRKSNVLGKAYFEDYIRDNKIYISSIDKQDDKLEGITPSTVKRMQLGEECDVEQYYKDAMYRILCNYLKGLTIESFNNIYKCFNSEQNNILLIADEVKKYYPNHSYSEIVKISKNLIILNENFQKELGDNERVKNGIVNVINANAQTGISAFSEIPNDDQMWAHYADNFKGYCVEYDLSDIDANRSFIESLFPVLYEQTKNDDWLQSLYKSVFYSMSIGDYMLIKGQSVFVSDLTTMMCTKLLKWEDQFEWRIIGVPDTKIDGPKIESIIVGDNISKEDFEKIEYYCSDKYEIKIVKMNYLTQTLEISKISEEDIKRIKTSR